MEVRISGCVFASLFLELANSKGDIEGFLFGEISARTTNTVSDSQDITIKQERIFAVQELLVCRGLFCFYDGVGRIHPEKLNSILGDKKQVALGWFKFRRNSRLRMSMREKGVHKNLIEHLNIQESQDFIFSVFTSSRSTNLSTHLFQYSACYCLNSSRVFSGVPVAIVNLGNTAQTEYKQYIEPTRSTSKTYQNVIGSYRDEFLDNVGQLQQVKHARSVYMSMLGKLNGLAETVHTSESQLSTISQQVKNLREELEKTLQVKREKGQQDLIILDPTDGEKDLISFDEPRMENGEKEENWEKEKNRGKGEKVVVVAKHISTSHSNRTHKRSSSFDDSTEARKPSTGSVPVEHVDGNASNVKNP